MNRNELEKTVSEALKYREEMAKTHAYKKGLINTDTQKALIFFNINKNVLLAGQNGNTLYERRINILRILTSKYPHAKEKVILRHMTKSLIFDSFHISIIISSALGFILFLYLLLFSGITSIALIILLAFSAMFIAHILIMVFLCV